MIYLAVGSWSAARGFRYSVESRITGSDLVSRERGNVGGEI